MRYKNKLKKIENGLDTLESLVNNKKISLEQIKWELLIEDAKWLIKQVKHLDNKLK